MRNRRLENGIRDPASGTKRRQIEDDAFTHQRDVVLLVPLVDFVGQDVVFDGTQFLSAQSPVLLRGRQLRTLFLSDVHEDHTLDLTSRAFEPALSIFTQDLVNAYFDNHQGVSSTNLPETDVGLFLAVLIFALEIDIYSLLARFLSVKEREEILTDEGVAIVVAVRSILINFLAPLGEPFLKPIQRTVVQDAGRGFDNNTRSGRIVLNINNVRVGQAPQEVVMVTDSELRDWNTALELEGQVVDSLRVQVIDRANVGPLQEFRETPLGIGIHGGCRSAANKSVWGREKALEGEDAGEVSGLVLSR